MNETNHRTEVQFEIYDKEANRNVPLQAITFDFALKKILINGVVWDSSKTGLTKAQLLQMIQDFAALFEDLNGTTDTPANQ